VLKCTRVAAGGDACPQTCLPLRVLLHSSSDGGVLTHLSPLSSLLSPLSSLLSPRHSLLSPLSETLSPLASLLSLLYSLLSPLSSLLLRDALVLRCSGVSHLLSILLHVPREDSHHLTTPICVKLNLYASNLMHMRQTKAVTCLCCSGGTCSSSSYSTRAKPICVKLNLYASN
jgi:hypothetical protein